MLQRLVHQSPQRFQSISSLRTCAVCQCSCGRTIRHDGPTIQRRHVNRASPAVWNKQNRRRVVTADEASRRKKDADRLVELEAARLRQTLINQKRARLLDGEVENVIVFLNKFSALAAQSQAGRVGVPVVSEPNLKALSWEYGLSESDLVKVAVLALLRIGNQDYGLLGKRLLYSTSNAGSEAATIRIMQHALVSSKDRPNTLKSLELVNVHAHLREIARKGKNYRAMVLEGKIAYALRDYETAITLWRQAMEAAVAAAEEAKRLKAYGIRPADDPTTGGDLSDLSSPWIELQSIYLSRSDYNNAKWVIEVGCEQDDPSSHYAAALFEKKFNDRGDEVVTSAWLYHMTKAAASGFVSAMHELGIWYAQQGWPYIDDEPPDYIKPTPFDRYPPDAHVRSATKTSLKQKVRTALGRDAPPEEDPKSSVFHTAAYPTTPLQRYQMSLQWLELAMEFTYAPSFLAAARLHLDKTLWPEAVTPIEALELRDKRYTYVSKADYENERPIKSPPTAGQKKRAAKDAIPNPFYSPEKARELVRQIFYAASALEIRRFHLKNFTDQLRHGTAPSDLDSDTIAAENFLPEDMSPNVKKWYRYPEVREQYMNDRTGKLYDEVLGIDPLEVAMKICDEHGWDIYAQDGSLLYRHGMIEQRNAPKKAAAASR